MIGERGACGQRAVLQGAGEIEHPQIRLNAAALGGTGDGVAEVGARIEQQHQRAMQVIRADVGHADVVAHRAGAVVRARIAEVQLHRTAHVQQRGKSADAVLADAQLAGAAQVAADGQLVVTGGQAADVEIRGMRGGIPSHRGGRDRGGAGIGRLQHIVLRVEHAGAIGQCRLRIAAQPHVLVELDGDLIERQRHQGAVRHAGGQYLGRARGSDFVDVVGLRDEDAAIGGGDHAFALRAAAGHLQHAARLQLDHPHGRAVRAVGDAVDLHVLGQAAGSDQHTVQQRAALAEGDMVDHTVEAVLQLGTAQGGAAHRKADDVSGAVGISGGDVATAPLHPPQASIRAEGER